MLYGRSYFSRTLLFENKRPVVSPPTTTVKIPLKIEERNISKQRERERELEKSVWRRRTNGSGGVSGVGRRREGVEPGGGGLY